jgi:hypothetical protein
MRIPPCVRITCRKECKILLHSSERSVLMFLLGLSTPRLGIVIWEVRRRPAMSRVPRRLSWNDGAAVRVELCRIPSRVSHNLSGFDVPSANIVALAPAAEAHGALLMKLVVADRHPLVDGVETARAVIDDVVNGRVDQHVRPSAVMHFWRVGLLVHVVKVLEHVARERALGGDDVGHPRVVEYPR